MESRAWEQGATGSARCRPGRPLALPALPRLEDSVTPDKVVLSTGSYRTKGAGAPHVHAFWNEAMSTIMHHTLVIDLPFTIKFQPVLTPDATQDSPATPKKANLCSTVDIPNL